MAALAASHNAHSPRERGFWFAHVGWSIAPQLSYDPRYVNDLHRRRDLASIDRHGFAWYALGLVLPGVFCGIVSGTWEGALMGFLWGGLYRQFVVQQLTYAVNSVGHLWGSQAHDTADASRTENSYRVPMQKPP